MLNLVIGIIIGVGVSVWFLMEEVIEITDGIIFGTGGRVGTKVKVSWGGGGSI